MQLPSVRESFAALNAAIGKRMEDPKAPVTLSPEHRASLVSFAEANIHSGAGNAAIGRVQAQYVAGMMAVLDAGQARSPFKDPELTKAYEAQRAFGETVDEPQPVVG
jgi:hypothetical protein